MAAHRVFLCIGGNLGDRLANLEETRFFIDCNFGSILQESSIYESPGWQMTDVPAFLNQVLEIETDLTWQALLDEIRELEEFYGKPKRKDEYLSREMDVDVLFYDDLILSEDEMVVPHPRLTQRKFVLLPLSEIAGELVHPIEKKSVLELLKECDDTSELTKIP
jgi:2-amino-4-hydroxy-6-hydroxymethyldihydropteridine diphosphokinase